MKPEMVSVNRAAEKGQNGWLIRHPLRDFALDGPKPVSSVVKDWK